MSLTAAQTRALAKVEAWARQHRDLSDCPADLDGYVDWAIKSGFYTLTTTRSGKIILEGTSKSRSKTAGPATRLLAPNPIKQQYKCGNCGDPIFRARSYATGKVRELDAHPQPGGGIEVPDITAAIPYFRITNPEEIPATEADMRPGFGYGVHTCQAATLFDPTPHIKEQQL